MFETMCKWQTSYSFVCIKLKSVRQCVALKHESTNDGVVHTSPHILMLSSNIKFDIFTDVCAQVQVNKGYFSLMKRKQGKEFLIMSTPPINSITVAAVVLKPHVSSMHLFNSVLRAID
uniref:Uncharacterized protein n=1 Tax=Glossina austeni TaxID=7395 RepID=A0A1A9VAL2_GLOAU